jgi:DNA-binding MarR family transcriptional regulator
MAQLARQSFVAPQTTADLVTALERRCLVSRARNAGDRREMAVSLTSAGHGLLAAHEQQVRDLERRMVAALTAGEVTRFGELLECCRRSLAEAGTTG